MKCPWYNDGMCMYDDEESECIEEYTIYKCIDNPANIEYTPYIENLFPWSPEEKNKQI